MADDAPAWGSVLQDKYVGAHAVACCPSMDLIAVLTQDRQLLVHRTISWQRVVHVKPSEVFFAMETLVWSPDGMRLAVGCDEGEVVVFSMVSANDDKGTEIMPHTDSDELCHEVAIIAMHWVQVCDNVGLSRLAVPPSAKLHNRPTGFAADSGPMGKNTEEASVLVTADRAGRVGLWWNGLVLVAVVPIRDRWIALQNQKGSSLEQGYFTIHAAMLAADLSALIVDVSHGIGDGNTEGSRLRTVLRIDLSRNLQDVQRDLSVISRVGFEVRSSLNIIHTTLRQIASEWKNATRVFELKMSLLESLYRKYDCEEPPQVDMLAIVAGGLASPALAQFFAQDIQEMSIIRMQKLFFSGCDTIQNLMSSKIKCNLQKSLFDVAELRGTVKWNHVAFSETLGISTAELDTAIENIGNLIATMEQFEMLLVETRNNFAQLFSWLLEQVKTHTNDTTSRPQSGAARLPDASSKSLLNSRRLVLFFERAIQTAKDFQVQKNNKWLVEVTFGNEVSKLFASSKLMLEVAALDKQWNNVMNHMVRALSVSVGLSRLYPVDLGGEVDEVKLHTRWMDEQLVDSDVDNQVMSDDDHESDDGDSVELDVLQVVDWDSLESLRVGRKERARNNIVQLLIFVRRGHHGTFLSTWGGFVDSNWSKQEVNFGFLCGGDGLCSSIHHSSLYGGINSGKQEQLVVTDYGGAGSICMVDYNASFRKQQSWHHGIDKPTKRGSVKRRNLQMNASLAESIVTIAVVTQASRGIVCVKFGDSRLIILDAEEGPDVENESEVQEGEGKKAVDSDDHEEVDI